MTDLARRIYRRVVPIQLRVARYQIPAKWHMVRAYRGLSRSPRAALRYVLLGRETDNFTYDIDNTSELSAFLAAALHAEVDAIAGYVRELETDVVLERAVNARLQGRRDRNTRMPFGRRLGWYAVARQIKPAVVVETGVHDGLGSTALLRALERNAADGHEGRLISVDITPDAGWLVPDWLRVQHQVLIGDALTMLPGVLKERGVGMFIHDSDHRYEHETAEFELMSGYAAPGAALISDNAHAGTAFRDFCARNGIDFRFWREQPRDHFYPGAGIGLGIVPPGGPAGS